MTLDQRIAEKLDLEGFTEEEKLEIVEMLKHSVVERGFGDILDTLSDEERKMLGELDEQKFAETVNKLVELKIQKFEEIFLPYAEAVIKEFNTLRHS